jgi:hypothetical protein
MDKWGQFFGWVGIASFLLAVPLAVLANILTPKVRDWWASTSQKRRARRYKQLGTQISNYEKTNMGEALSTFLLTLSRVIALGIFGVMALQFFDALNTDYVALKNGQTLELYNIDQITGFGYLVGGMFCVCYLAFIIYASKATQDARSISPKFREGRIAALKLEQNRLGIAPSLVDNS